MWRAASIHRDDRARFSYFLLSDPRRRGTPRVGKLSWQADGYPDRSGVTHGMPQSSIVPVVLSASVPADVSVDGAVDAVGDNAWRSPR